MAQLVQRLLSQGSSTQNRQVLYSRHVGSAVVIPHSADVQHKGPRPRPLGTDILLMLQKLK